MKKKTNVVPIHTKNDKQCIKKYRPLSLLPICSKIFEKSFLTNCTSFLMKMTYYHLTNQAFDPVKYITHKIYQSFDNDLEVRRVFLDISKAFDKVWHEGLILKLSRNGICGNLLNLLKDFLKYRKQSVRLDGQNSSWKGIISGDLQGSILGTLLFLIYINDFSNGLLSNCKLFVDGRSHFSVVHDAAKSSSEVISDLAKISEWAFKWKISFNLVCETRQWKVFLLTALPRIPLIY